MIQLCLGVQWTNIDGGKVERCFPPRTAHFIWGSVKWNYSSVYSRWRLYSCEIINARANLKHFELNSNKTFSKPSWRGCPRPTAHTSHFMKSSSGYRSHIMVFTVRVCQHALWIQLSCAAHLKVKLQHGKSIECVEYSSATSANYCWISTKLLSTYGHEFYSKMYLKTTKQNLSHLFSVCIFKTVQYIIYKRNSLKIRSLHMLYRLF